MNHLQILSSVILSAALLFTGCESNNHDEHASGMKTMSSSSAGGAMAQISPSKGAATQPSNNHVTGTVSFSEASGGVKVTAHIMGLSPGEHGFHIHDAADLSDPALKGAGPHYNPGHHQHGGPETPEHHAGDLGNITADAQGNAHLDAMMMNVKLSDLIGKSVIVHAGPDDLKTDPAGNSGARVAGGVIKSQ
jgi:Cu-Zn family superoxide dismutase